MRSTSPAGRLAQIQVTGVLKHLRERFAEAHSRAVFASKLVKGLPPCEWEKLAAVAEARKTSPYEIVEMLLGEFFETTAPGEVLQ